MVLQINGMELIKPFSTFSVPDQEETVLFILKIDACAP